MLGKNLDRRGRVLAGDQVINSLESESESGTSQDSEIERTNERQASSGWVLGIYLTSTQKRFIAVPDRRADTLIPIIQQHVVPGSWIWTDEWPSYSRLNSLGFNHQTVNHSENFIDPSTGAHTQGVERSWKEEKCWLRMIRRPTQHIRSRLDESVWRSMNNIDARGLYSAFMRALRVHYSRALCDN